MAYRDRFKKAQQVTRIPDFRPGDRVEYFDAQGRKVKAKVKSLAGVMKEDVAGVVWTVHLTDGQSRHPRLLTKIDL